MSFVFLNLVFGLFIICFGVWSSLGIYFQIKGLGGVVITACWAFISFLAFYTLVFTGSAWVWAYGAVAVLYAGFWYLLPARLDRDWVDELAHTVTGTIDDRHVTLHNVRDFDWDIGAQNWINRDFNLDALQGLDVILSYWGNAKIAHAIISFRFNDVEPVAFSVEIRKEKGELYSPISGFFKTFEQAFIAANERDIVALRTNYRDPIEDVYLYPLKTDLAEVEALFLGYVRRANKLARKAAWYHTITANCTTVVFDLVHSSRKELKFDRRILMSGLLPDLFAERGTIDRPQPYGNYRAAAAITAKGQAVAPHQSYSAAIRK